MSGHFHPRLPPPSQLEASYTPQSPPSRPRYSDLAIRAPYPSYPRHIACEHSSSQGYRAVTQPQAGSERSPYSSGFPHPPLYPQKLSYQSTNAGTLYEALSPIDYANHGHASEPSMANEGCYNISNNYATSGSQHHQSPTSSYHSSTTSSSGWASGSMQNAKSGSSPEAASSMLDRYILSIRQQPMAARACGFGERDRRVIDPPPIVQLALANFDPSLSSDVAELRWPFNVVHCSLLSLHPSDYANSSDVTTVQDPNQSNRVSRRLMGTLVASPFVGTDPEIRGSGKENSRLGCFFVFPDLSCRQNGRYKLRFTLMKVNMPNMAEGGQGSIAGSIDSEEFEVFSAKDFPGMRASTALTKELKRQGATVSVKKGKGQKKRGGSGSDRSSDEGSDRSAEVTKSRQRKKRV